MAILFLLFVIPLKAKQTQGFVPSSVLFDNYPTTLNQFYQQRIQRHDHH
jgi:hypothetical protein